MIVSTTYLSSGELSKAATRRIKGNEYQAPRVGGISSETRAGKDTKMMIKHKSNEPVDRNDLETVVAKAGNYQLL